MLSLCLAFTAASLIFLVLPSSVARSIHLALKCVAFDCGARLFRGVPEWWNLALPSTRSNFTLDLLRPCSDAAPASPLAVKEIKQAGAATQSLQISSLATSQLLSFACSSVRCVCVCCFSIFEIFAVPKLAVNQRRRRAETRKRSIRRVSTLLFLTCLLLALPASFSCSCCNSGLARLLRLAI